MNPWLPPMPQKPMNFPDVVLYAASIPKFVGVAGLFIGPRQTETDAEWDAIAVALKKADAALKLAGGEG